MKKYIIKNNKNQYYSYEDGPLDYYWTNNVLNADFYDSLEEVTFSLEDMYQELKEGNEPKIYEIILNFIEKQIEG